MIVKKHVEKDLMRLNELYLQNAASPDPSIPVYFSKLGVLELSGWLEESFDAIARRSMKNRIATTKFDNLANEAIKKNHGFTYDNNFLVMMSKIIGLHECEQLDEWLDSDGSLGILRSEINSIHAQRRKAAHVNIAQTTIGFDTPSVSLNRLKKIHPILVYIYRWFC